jgi:cardiolipin synthase
MKRILRVLTGRFFVRSVIIVAQAAIIVASVLWLNAYSVYVGIAIAVCSVLVALVIVNDDMNPMFKSGWLVLMLIFPVSGWVFFLIFRKRRLSKQLKSRYEKVSSVYKNVLSGNAKTTSRIAKYIDTAANSHAYTNTRAEYFPLGQDFFPEYLKRLKNAENFIFIEYFIIAEGKMWDSVFAVLREKAEAGVEVRVMYDELGSLSLMPNDFAKKLRQYGIKAVVFNPVRASVDSLFNYRDHRKITVIDGKFAFTGGLNISDEYINVKRRFGTWKDCTVMLEGTAVWEMTVLFLELWNLYSLETDSLEEVQRFCPEYSAKTDGVVMPFGDGPLQDGKPSKAAYMSIIQSATDYVYICTPYLVLDDAMSSALRIAAKSGVDVRLLIPGIPDKKYVYTVTKANCEPLLQAGVKVYTYTQGFVHSKTIVADGEFCVVGTANFDFRSFYFHFENGVFFHGSSVAEIVKADFLTTIADCCEMSSVSPARKNVILQCWGGFLKLISPFM